MTDYTLLIQAEYLSAVLPQPGWVIIDCSFSLADSALGLNQYLTQHIPGARYAHLDDDLAAELSGSNGRHPLPDPDAFNQTLRAWGVNSDSQVVVYDNAMGGIAVRLWWMLKWLGHDRVALLDGGIRRWIELGLPLQAEAVDSLPGDFEGQADDDRWLGMASLISTLQRDQCVLVDARSKERFEGLREPIDAVAGHVAGAVNLPFEDNLDDQGLFHSPARLRQRFAPMLEQHGSAQIVHMCGSGVTACHNLLAMEIAGLTGSRLYPGSWSEWIADPDRLIVSSAP